MKKSYISPEVKVYRVQPTAILADSLFKLSSISVDDESMVGAKGSSDWENDDEDEE